MLMKKPGFSPLVMKMFSDKKPGFSKCIFTVKNSSLSVILSSPSRSHALRGNAFFRRLASLSAYINI
ncbi:Uncharacterized protein dnm_028060 [Desulfonema magnum]|uniref:Uncharacterized protein n=1 Tax=Desulfonema magnum TaxID=45655 RepID=A0A975BJL5_9BACT|nr:Uncharacterized protein dnm_028060 [Desulfonema magnum]